MQPARRVADQRSSRQARRRQARGAGRVRGIRFRGLEPDEHRGSPLRMSIGAAGNPLGARFHRRFAGRFATKFLRKVAVRISTRMGAASPPWCLRRDQPEGHFTIVAVFGGVGESIGMAVRPPFPSDQTIAARARHSSGPALGLISRFHKVSKAGFQQLTHASAGARLLTKRSVFRCLPEIGFRDLAARVARSPWIRHARPRGWPVGASW